MLKQWMKNNKSLSISLFPDEDKITPLITVPLIVPGKDRAGELGQLILTGPVAHLVYFPGADKIGPERAGGYIARVPSGKARALWSRCL
jgi:hypothetical protein